MTRRDVVTRAGTARRPMGGERRPRAGASSPSLLFVRSARAVAFTSLMTLGSVVHPQPASAQAAGADSMLAGRLDPAIYRAVTPSLDSARATGLPIRPLLDKSLEGQSKQAAPDRVAAVVRGLVVELRAARDALGNASSENDLVAGASALHAGAPPSVLTALRRARGRDPLAVPLAVLAELVARGVGIDTASNAVVTLAHRGLRDAEFVGFQQSVEHDVAVGAPPSLSAVIRAADMDAATSLGGSPAALPHSPPPPVVPPTRP